MPSKPDHPDAVREAFRKLHASDVARGQRCGLSQYQARFPGFEAVITDEFARLEAVSVPALAPTGLRATVVSPAAAIAPRDDTATPERIGPYRILSVLGEGGMGTVFLAEQREPVRRRVALKLIKLGMDSKQVLARFEAERQALAVMNHDNIARVFDAGTSQRGQPYFVMEHVEGIPMADYCDQHKLTIQQRIGLFQQVCAGVQHAHQKGVIHRDLKPGNVLVTRREDRAVPKIIDFGLARATEQQLVGQTLFTEQGQVIGTPEYMSPEQAGADAQGIDTRTDIYSLGVMLYELLAGELPFSSKELRSAGLLEIQRKIREDQPPKPSTRVSTRGAAGSECAGRRRMSTQALSKHLRGDLDWIVLKAMAKEPERRYESATGVAMDLGRFLEHQPVLAGPPGVGYRMQKFARRYRGQLLAAGLVFVALVAGLGAATHFWLQSRAQAILAQQHATAAETARAAEAVKGREFDQLAGIAHLERLQLALGDLATPWQNLTAAEVWIADADRLIAMRPALERTVTDLRNRAMPTTPSEAARDRATHPQHAQWLMLQARLAKWEHTLAMQSGDSLQLPSITEAEQGLTPHDLMRIASRMVDPVSYTADRQAAMPRALALAQHAWAKSAATGIDASGYLATLAWAWFWNGRDDEALHACDAALALDFVDQDDVQRDLRTMSADLRRRIATGEGKAAVRSFGESVVRLRTEVSALERSIGQRRSFRFESEAQSFLHAALTALMPRLAAFESTDYASVALRLRCAELTTNHPKARTTWQQAAEATAKADGVVASALYGEHPIRLLPQLGLVPIGMNPVTKLWEFYELRSAWDPSKFPDPAALNIPRHDADGGIAVDDDTGIVFVLLPGGTFTMGAQNSDGARANYDTYLFNSDDGPPHRVTLAPLFLARHELTRGQWRRLGGTVDRPSDPGGISWLHDRTGDTLPVGDVDWLTSDALLRSIGLALPTEAQWEYGCRAGTTTPWWTGPDVSTALSAFDLLMPVGSRQSNAFGLFDTHGNVMEWCADWWGDYLQPWRPGDGLRLVEEGSPTRTRVSRGGHALHYINNDRQMAILGRSAQRASMAPESRGSAYGLRCARPMQTDD